MKKVIVLIALCLFALVACETGRYVTPTFNKEGETLSVKVVKLRTEDFKKKVVKYQQGMSGQAIYYLNDSENTCTIYVANDLKSNKVDGVYTTIVGHELMHCLYGDYHK